MTALIQRLRRGPRVGSEAGQALVETVMATGFLVGIAIVMNRLFRPVFIDAFEQIAKALSAVGP